MREHTSESFSPHIIDKADNIVTKWGRSDWFPLMRLSIECTQIRGMNNLLTDVSVVNPLAEVWSLIFLRHFFIRSHMTLAKFCLSAFLHVSPIDSNTADAIVWLQSEIWWWNDIFFIKFLENLPEPTWSTFVEKWLSLFLIWSFCLFVRIALFPSPIDTFLVSLVDCLIQCWIMSLLLWLNMEWSPFYRWFTFCTVSTFLIPTGLISMATKYILLRRIKTFRGKVALFYSSKDVVNVEMILLALTQRLKQESPKTGLNY